MDEMEFKKEFEQIASSVIEAQFIEKINGIALVEKSGLSSQLVYKIIKAQGGYTVATLLKACKALGLEISLKKVKIKK